MQEKDKAADYMAVFPEKLVLTEGEGGALRLAIREPERFSLHVICDSPDRHPVDRIATIPGDGTSYTTINIQKIDERGVPQRGEAENDTLYLRTNYGTLRDIQGDTELGSIQLRNGRAQMRLVSESIKRVATVQIMSADPETAERRIPRRVRVAAMRQTTIRGRPSVDVNLELLRRVATRIGKLRERAMFLGGTIVPLLLPEPFAAGIRVAKDCRHHDSCRGESRSLGIRGSSSGTAG